ncbi:hypothetical protein FACS189426_04370 [Bacteroidia bacterium]|nr:hypothetical protein FACS189426_04370 [Bacteroidia bacterium]
MSKKKTTSKTQELSPEKYIRQKSQNLPIFKCWINTGWDDEKFAQIIISRKHANGNLTACVYLTDLACLGVKDTDYFFNVPVETLEEKLNQNPSMKFDEISYPLAHNIIYAAIEFAEEYGFEPHKDYTQTTYFFLEEDTDDIPLIEIECGSKKDRKPLYINAGHDSPARAKQIIAQLEKTAGNGNFNFITEIDGDHEDYEDEDEDFDEDEDEEDFKEEFDMAQELLKLDKEEQKALFFELAKINEKESSPKDFKKWLILANLLIWDIVDEKAIDKYMDIIEKDLDYSVIEIDELPNSLFAGIQDKDPDIICNLFYDTLDVISDDIKRAEQALKEFRDEMGDVPVAAFMELQYLAKKSKKKYTKKLEEYYTKYPDYLLIRLKWHIHLFETQKNIFQRNINVMNLKSLLSESNQVTYYESDAFMAAYMAFCILSDNDNPEDMLTKIITFEKYLSINDFLVNKDALNELSSFLFIAKIAKLTDYFKNTNT